VYDNELRGLAWCCWQWVVGEYSIPKFLKAKEDVSQRAMVREELDLSRTVEQNIVICANVNTRSLSCEVLLRTSEFLQAFLQPVKVVLQLLERKQHSAVRP
jgi:hypothetical protein